MGFISTALAVFCFLIDVSYFMKVWLQTYPYVWGIWKKSRELKDEVVNYGEWVFSISL